MHGLVEDYGVSQARLAEVIGASPAMLGQLVAAQRIKLGDPVANARLMILAQRRVQARRLDDPSKVDEVLAEIARVQRPWPLHVESRAGWAATSMIDLLCGDSAAVRGRGRSAAGRVPEDRARAARGRRRRARLIQRRRPYAQ